jgi:ribosomal protein L37AE/L43A
MRAQCDRCAHVTTVRLGEDGWWRCSRCDSYTKAKGASA